MNELTQNGAYHERAANGNLCMVIWFKNFRCGLIIEILENGYQIFYSELYPCLGKQMTKEQCQFVIDVLTIYRIIETYKNRNLNDIDIDSHVWSRFQGFDGNGEYKYMGFTQFLVNTQGQFQELEKHTDGLKSFNSHPPTLPKYKSMVRKWKALESSYTIEGLERDSVLEILNAQPIMNR